MSSFLALGLFGKVEPMLCGSNSNFPTTFAEIKFFMGRNRIIIPWQPKIQGLQYRQLIVHRSLSSSYTTSRVHVQSNNNHSAKIIKIFFLLCVFLLQYMSLKLLFCFCQLFAGLPGFVLHFSFFVVVPKLIKSIILLLELIS